MLLGGRLADIYGQRRLFLSGSLRSPWRRSRAGLPPPGDAGGGARGPGRGRSGGVGGGAVADHGAVPDGRAREGDGLFRVRDGGRRKRRRAAGRGADRPARLALDLPDQPAGRRGGGLAVRWSCCRSQAARASAGCRRRHHDHGLAAAGGLCRRRWRGGGLASAADPGLLARAALLLRCSWSSSCKGEGAARAAGLFKLRNISVANIVGVLWAAAMFAWFFLSALYMQLVLDYRAAAGGPRLPAVQPDHGRLLLRPLGQDGEPLRHPAAAGVGLLLAAAGLALFARAPVDGGFGIHVMPSMTAARARRRHRVQPDPAGGDERCRAA